MMNGDIESLGVSTTAAGLLRDLIHERTGLFYENGRFDAMLGRVGPLVIARGFQSLLDYYYLLKYEQAERDEWLKVADALAVNETYFWREADQLRAVAEVIVPGLVRESAGAPVRVWSIPCATGEEPLTLAMMLEAGGWFRRAPIEIVGSDASPAAIAHARVGAYRERSLRGATREQRERYFTKEGDRWVVDRDIHRRVTWSVVNVRSAADAAPLASSPVVLCRNLFIYFSERAVRDTIGFLGERMPSPGYLCVGASESLLKLQSAFSLEEIGGAFVYVKR